MERTGGCLDLIGFVLAGSGPAAAQTPGPAAAPKTQDCVAELTAAGAVKFGIFKEAQRHSRPVVRGDAGGSLTGSFRI